MAPETSILLVIDLQEEYREGGAYPVEDYDGVLAQAAALIAAARTTGVPVVHVQAWAEPGESLPFKALEAAARWGTAGSAGVAIAAEVAPRPDETVVRKRWPSAFRETGLDALLRDRGATDLLVCGVWTDSCVRGTVLDAVAADFRVWLVKDACGSATATMHRTAVLDMANRLYGGGVVRTTEAVKALRGEAFAAWRCTRPIALPYTLATLDALYDGL